MRRIASYNRMWAALMSLVMVLCLIRPAEPARASGPLVSVQTGLSSQHDYLEYDVGTAGTLYVNQYTTKPHVRRTDLTLGGSRMPVEIEFWYDEENLTNDLTAAANPYGYGWMTSYNQLLEYHSANEQYAFRNTNGTWIYFEDSGEVTEEEASIWTETAFAEEARTDTVLTLEEDALRTDYTAVTITQAGYSSTFDASGRLISITDEYYNTLTITYVNQTGPAISLITDGVGRKYAFSYINGWLNEIACQDSTGLPITVQNTAIDADYTIVSGLLTETSYEAEYVYDSSRRITALWGEDGIGCCITYGAGTQEVLSITKQSAMDTASPLSGTITEISKSGNQVIITEGRLQQAKTYDAYGRSDVCAISELIEGNGVTVPQLLYGLDYIYEEVLQPDGRYISRLADIEFFDGTGSEGEGRQSISPLEPGTEEEEGKETGTGGETREGGESGGGPGEEESSFSETRDQYGNVVSETNTVGDLSQTTFYTYSADGNYLASVTNEDGLTTSYSFDSLSGILLSVTDGMNHTTSYSYNALRELTAASLPVTNLANNAEGMSAAYTYSHGRISSVIYGDFIYNFTYDTWGNITLVTMGGSPLVSYNYGTSAEKGQVQSLTYGNGQQVFYGYNDREQIISVGYNGQINRFTYSYDEEGKLASISDSVTGQTTLYTEDGTELRDSEDNLLYSLEAGEDEGTIERTICGGSWSYTESNDSATPGSTVFTISQDNNELVSGYSEYDTLGRHTDTFFSASGTAFREEKTYYTNNNSEGTLVSNYEVTAANSNAETSLSGEYTYTYDANGNLTREIRSFEELTLTPLDPPIIPPIGIEGSPAEPDIFNPAVDPEIWDISGSVSYTYDEAGQLTEAFSPNRSRYSYTYDESGNLISSEIRINTSAIHLPLLRWTLTGKSFTYNTKGQLTGYNKTAASQTVHTGYTLDEMGNPVTITVSTVGSLSDPVVKTLSWGEGRMLTGIGTDADNYIHYTYNADGLRVRKTVCRNGLELEYNYIWDDGRLIAEYDDFRTVTVLYDSDNSPIGFAVEANGAINPEITEYYYLKNLQGDITHILNGSGETVVTYTYDPWGSQTVSGNAGIAAINPFSYRGYCYDQETGWYYLQSRYYDPEIGRFLNADEAIPASITGNEFSYCFNNPVDNIDNCGLFGTPIQWACAVIGGIVGWCFGDYVARFVGFNPNGSFWSRTAYWAVRSLVVAGGAVAGYIAGTKLLGIIKQFIYNKGLLYKIPSVLRWFLGLGVETQLANSLYNNYQQHIFGNKAHGWDDVIKTGISKRQIFDTIFGKTQQLITLANNGSNEIRTYLWGRQVTIRFFFQDGVIRSIDSFVGWSSRIIGKYIKGY